MEVDGQAAVGDQLTTDGGSAFGLREGGMVAWKHCSQMRHSVSSPMDADLAPPCNPIIFFSPVYSRHRGEEINIIFAYG